MADINESKWFEYDVPLGSRLSTRLVVSQSFSGNDVAIPLHIWRGREAGPTVCLTAAVHGDEINGVGVLRQLIREAPFELLRGTLVIVPVVNLIGFERHARNLPDRRDLNRSFPGSYEGSLTARLARTFFDGIVSRCDYGIDLHSAAVRRTNFPNVRADLSDEKQAGVARAFGAELIINCIGPKGSLRAAANRVGCATMILEAGEVWKVEPTMVEYTLRGISNCLQFLGMIDGKLVEPAYRIETDATQWIRAQFGGFLDFHVSPGQTVSSGDVIATNTNLVGKELGKVIAPRNGIIVGMTTSPSVGPGDPVCHLAFARSGALRKVERAVEKLDESSLHTRVRDDLARSMNVTEES